MEGFADLTGWNIYVLSGHTGGECTNFTRKIRWKYLDMCGEKRGSVPEFPSPVGVKNIVNGQISLPRG
jgi:hypothetical protein